MSEQRLTSPRFTRWAAIFALALLSLACSSGPAGATTVGGQATYGSGPLALVAGRLFTPTFLTNNAGEASPGPPVTEMETYLESFVAGKHGAHTLALDVSTSGSAPAALATSAGRLATAWVGSHGFQTALVTANGAALRTPVTVPVSGSVGGYVVAIDTSGARAVLWLDSLGIRLQVVSPVGVAALPLTLAPGTTSFFSLTADDTGGWWAVWIAASGRVLAADVEADGTIAPPIDLAGAPAHAAGARMLYTRLWTAVADGQGGVWVGLPGGLLHVERTGVAERRSAHKLTLAEGDSRSALAEDLGGGGIVVRPVGRLGRSVRLRHIGSLLAIAYDDSRQTTELLSAVARGRVELTTLSKRVHVASRLVRGCPPAGTGELVASGGLVGVACASRTFEAESVETGGDFKGGRDIHYYLVRGGRPLHGETFFEGVHDY
ncbi:MAG TPA: hypothetical protein VHS55_09255 [Solirubrobacteraceae bacterium]|nr:hypothetical protein [Solirubrobacteraceae bacterium]